MPVTEWYEGLIGGHTSSQFFSANNPSNQYADIQARPVVGRFPDGPPLLRVTDLAFQVNPDGTLTYFWSLTNDGPDVTYFVFRMYFEGY